MAKKKVTKIKATFGRERVTADAEGLAKELYDQSRFGELKEGKIQYSLVEALLLLEKEKMEIKEGRKKLKVETFIEKAREVEPKFWVRYCVFRDMRQRGYIVKTALKFGADFRIYDRGVKPGEDHAKWIVYPVHETENMTMYEFAAKNRVAHSTKKRLLLAIVDEENECIYYEIKWVRP
ncbi:MAG: tRNA-intron lyase [Nanoarchaeota archaeon]|nr:tRNA-intron lyase [Nanoarchaeota archaeon]MCG2717527.1 tRNA-intron lyase [Nanoarchaeota archaeon]